MLNARLTAAPAGVQSGINMSVPNERRGDTQMPNLIDLADAAIYMLPLLAGALFLMSVTIRSVRRFAA